MSETRAKHPRTLRSSARMTPERIEQMIEAARADKRTYPAIDRADAYATLVDLICVTDGRLYRPAKINLMRLALRFAPKPEKKTG